MGKGGYDECQCIPSYVHYPGFHCGNTRNGLIGENGWVSLIWYVYPKSVVFSCIMSLLSAWEAVYNLFIYEAAGFMAGLAEAFAQLGAIAFCFLAVIAEIIVWAAAIHREKKRITSLDTGRAASSGTEGGGAHE